jgi:hypothetical protein
MSAKLLIVLSLFCFLLAGCAAMQPPDASGPRSNVPAYPIVIAAEESRREETAIAWRRLSQRYGMNDAPSLELEPGTSTLKELPPGLTATLPKVGDANPTEEDYRDSLRRFITEWQPLIGADPAQLTLVERVDEPSGVKVAKYEQRPFRYPLRGAYGNLIIRFRADRQIVGLSSSCLPNVDRVQPALAALNASIGAEEVATLLRSGPQTITGAAQTLTFTSSQSIEPKQLVVYAVTSPGGGIELHLCWEVDVTNAPIKTVYLDAVTGKTVAAS